MTSLSTAQVVISISFQLCLYLVPFLRYLASANGVILKSRFRSFKVIEKNGAVRQTIYDLLLVGHCQYSCLVPVSS